MRPAPSGHQTTGVVSKNDLGRTCSDLVRLIGNSFPSPDDLGPFRNTLVRPEKYLLPRANDAGCRPDDPGILPNDSGRLADDPPFTQGAPST